MKARSQSVLAAILKIVFVGACGIALAVAGFALLRSTEMGIKEDMSRLAALRTDVSEFEMLFLQARRAEKDFLLRRDAAYVARHGDVAAELRAQLAELREGAVPMSDDHVAALLADVEAAVDDYVSAFGDLVEAATALGLDETQGLQGELRSAVHNVEEILEGIGNPEMMVKMLMMRRHEKDFIMRVDTKYVGRLDERVAEFMDFPASMFPSRAVKAETETLLLAYQDAFKAFVADTLRDAELRTALSESYAASEPLVAALNDLILGNVKRMEETGEVMERRAFVAAATGLVVLVALFIGVAYRLAQSVAQPLQRLSHVVNRLAEGDLDVETPESQITEVRAIAQSLEVFRTNAVERAALERQTAELSARDAERKAAGQKLRDEEQARQIREAEERRVALEATRAAEQQAAAEIAEVVAACARGDFSKRLRTDDKDGVFAELCEGINAIGRVAEDGLAGVMDVIDRLAQGDLSGRMSESHQGIFAEIAARLNVTSEALVAIVGQIATSGRSIDTSSSDIATAMNDISRRTEQSAAALEQTAAALDELSASVKSTSDGALNVQKEMHDARREVAASVEVAAETVEAMKGIEMSSRQISKIVDVIDEIAFQTNLLALNAGVEAARAGEAGRGFAVVASEVRALAQRSSDAASEINTLISRSEREVETGVASVSRSRDALGRILSMVESVASRVTEIAEATVEQSSGISEINSAMNEIDTSTQQNAALFVETSAASQSMREESRKLSEAVSRFDVSRVESWTALGSEPDRLAS